ncbi:DUF3093 domain-containing protein [Cellulomonas xylanilytica]|uniref:DUF3093 domain-containing protein n=1 Tax=Cellulomonas xylanilytica TaxID=233583 RepID=A0A510V1N5_9CELL|nr:DUF3093 domain-containing protein [Cellulomonas xylanilytica]GEK19741.1 hypothetical protein CXY01_02610 [Cellulomonas xylanilytica]
MPEAPRGTPLPSSRTAVPTYAERLWLGPLGWMLLVVFAAMMAVAFVPLDPRVAVLVGVGVVVVGVVVLAALAPRVEVRDGVFRAGGAHIPVDLLGAAVPLDADETRAELGPRLDARAHVCLRGWIHSAVRVEVRDPQDPTPYWVVSTRRPAALAAALHA